MIGNPEECPKAVDGMHCEHWWDCGPCCRCGVIGIPGHPCDCDCCDADAPCKTAQAA